MTKSKNKTKALKTTDNNGSGFFRALLFGLVVCAVVWIVLSVLFSFVMSKLEDSSAVGKIFSSAVTVLSLLSGGFAAGKCDKTCAVLSSFVMGTIVLGICYALSSFFELSRDLGSVMKTVVIAVMLIPPVIGAKISAREKKLKTHYRKRM